MVDEWAKALVSSSCLPMGQDDLRDRLTVMARGLLRQVCGDAPSGVSAERIGRELAQDLLLTADAFQNALELIIPWLERVHRHTGEGTAACRAQAVAALAGGFAAGARDRVLDEQMRVTRAWLDSRHHALRAGLEEPGRFHSGLSDAPEPMGLLTAEGTVLEANAALLRLLDRPRPAVVGHRLLDFVLGEHDLTTVASALEAAVQAAGRPISTEFALTGAHGGFTAWADAALAWHTGSDRADGRIHLIMQDVTTCRAWQRRLQPRADRDQVTGLPTRRHFLHRVHTALTAGSIGVVGLCVLRVDGLAPLARAFGPAAGDRIATTIGSRVIAALSDVPDTALARLDRDRFAVLLTDPHHWTGVTELVKRLVDWVSAPIRSDTREVLLSPSVGVVQARPGVSAEELLDEAETALPTEHRDQRRLRTVTRPPHQDRQLQRAHLLAALPRALRDGEITLVWRPIADLATETVVGAEATATWRRPDRSIVADDLLDEAEALGLIRGWGPRILRQAAVQAARWRAALGEAAPRVTVNLPARFADDDALVEHVTAALRETGLPPEQLLLSMPESAVVDESGRPRPRLLKLNNLNVPVALDGLGTDIARYDHLPHLPLHTLVVSPTLTATLGSGDQSRCRQSVAAALISLGRELTQTVMVKGIDTVEQFRGARSLQAHQGAGDLIGRPAGPDEIQDMVLGGALTV
ncbi:GGDEF domain-containing protein [Saccharothrix syringae]|nr:GGDEF domain-containing protein [Saccharothrix syringae]